MSERIEEIIEIEKKRKKPDMVQPTVYIQKKSNYERKKESE